MEVGPTWMRACFLAKAAPSQQLLGGNGKRNSWEMSPSRVLRTDETSGLLLPFWPQGTDASAVPSRWATARCGCAFLTLCVGLSSHLWKQHSSDLCSLLLWGLLCPELETYLLFCPFFPQGPSSFPHLLLSQKLGGRKSPLVIKYLRRSNMLMPPAFPNGRTLCYRHRQNSGGILVSPELAKSIPEKEGMLGYYPVIELDFIVSTFLLDQCINTRKYK